MTNAHSEAGDNAGNCELCQKSDGGRQSTVPVYMGGGLGMGTMWMCEDCIEGKGGKEAIRLQAEADSRGEPRKK